MDLFFDTMNRLTPQLRAGDLAGCESRAIETLLALPESPFHVVAQLDIANSPEDIAVHFDRFIAKEAPRFGINAIYTEMNGYDINTDRWYCDLFAYETDGGVEDFDWLADWQSEYFDDYTIRGFETLQAVYASDAFHQDHYRDAAYLAGLVVVAKFQRFMQSATFSMKQLNIPLYATAHEYDYIARIATHMVKKGQNDFAT
jgi:hypothetical protein